MCIYQQYNPTYKCKIHGKKSQTNGIDIYVHSHMYTSVKFKLPEMHGWTNSCISSTESITKVEDINMYKDIILKYITSKIGRIIGNKT